MTLVELLVVVAILGLLSVVVLPNLSNTGDARKAREAARGLSGFVASTQSRAIGTRGGSGLWIEPLPNVITDAQGIEHLVAIDLFAATIPQPYGGESLDAAVVVAPSGATGNTAGLTFVPGGSFVQPSTLATASNAFIRFAGSPATFRLESSGGSAWQARMISGRNQTAYNTPWPVTGPLGIAYEVIVDATKDPSVSLSLGNAIGIDLTWTQLGSATPWGLTPSGTIPPLQIRASQVLYDSAGRPTNAVRSGGLAEPMIDPVCLLVAPLEMIQEATCFTKPGAYWVAIDPRGGAPRVGEVQLLSGAALDGKNRPASTAALITSQALVRQSTFQEGR
jgi:type II secretory pathway pseudopilin PulG